MQTCVVALAGHRRLAEGLTLLAAGRETKGTGGQDCIGDHVGKEVLVPPPTIRAAMCTKIFAATACFLQSQWFPAQESAISKLEACMKPEQHKRVPTVACCCRIRVFLCPKCVCVRAVKGRQLRFCRSSIRSGTWTRSMQ